ncbi:MAG: hypothetical protein NZ928_02350 [Endomicrobia bacterium]|nr:hypothetical protein [Endomicrobiia bacterium]MDW8056099.1 hypothetical protein [Elusimicrobiota bacterium]
MKKNILWILLVVITTGLYAATSGNYTIKVTIVEEQVGITIEASELNLGYVVKGTSITSTGSTAVKNVGAVNINLKLRISGKPSGWSVGTNSLSDVGQDKFVLATVFHEWNGLIVSTNPYACFDSNDILTESDKTAGYVGGGSGNNYFVCEGIPNQTVATPNYADGYMVGPSQQVNNHFFFNAPTSLSNSQQYGAEQTITVTVTGIQAQ